MSVTIGSLFSGIGGLELGLEMAGLGPVLWQVEIDPFCRAVLAKHWPEVPRYEDIRRVHPSQLRAVDVICGGFPCQDVSAAGKGSGMQGGKSSLWWEFVRILQYAQPPIVVVENVSSGARRWLPMVRGHLRMLGYRTRAMGIAAADVGAPHIRKRIFVLAYSDGGALWDVAQRMPKGRADAIQGQGESVPSDDGSIWPMADADGQGELQPGRGMGEVGRRSSDGGRPWAAEPDVDRVAHGVPLRTYRLRALGNSVVPQCAEVVGQVILQLGGA